MSTTDDIATVPRARRRPWVVPAAVTAVVVGTAVAVPLIADADSPLPERSAGELLVGLSEAQAVPFAGTMVYSADLGIPDLPSPRGGDTSLTSLLSGATTARIWYTDPQTYRVALHGELSELDVIRDGEDLWYWDSDENLVAHESVPDGAPADPHVEDGPASMLSSEAMAEMALRWIEPSTEIEVDGTATVAGRSAYELVVRPRDERSLVGSIRLAIDGEHGVPLRIRVYGSDGGDPAIEAGFTSISFDEPDPSVYQFTPPPGASVEELDAQSWFGKGAHDPHADLHRNGAGEDIDVEVVGSGWTSVLVFSGMDREMLAGYLGELSDDADQHVSDISGLLEALLGEMQPMSGPYGTGLGLQTTLASVLWLDDGRVLLGAVSLDVLEEAAS